MKKRIESMSIQQTSRVIGTLFLIVTAFLFIPLGVMAIIREGFSTGSVFLGLPIAYGFAFYLLTIVVCWVYNIIVPYVGGIEFSINEIKED